MATDLKFIETLTVNQFKAKMNVERLDIKKNPHTGKLFFSYGAKIGAVSAKGIPSKPMVSEVCGEDGETFYLLHNEGEGAATIASL
jgi:hypothetical protein